MESCLPGYKQKPGHFFKTLKTKIKDELNEWGKGLVRRIAMGNGEDKGQQSVTRITFDGPGPDQASISFAIAGIIFWTSRFPIPRIGNFLWSRKEPHLIMGFKIPDLVAA